EKNMPKKSNKGIGNLTVEVCNENSVVKVLNALGKITGHNKPPGNFKKSASFSGNTGLFGVVKFIDIPLDMYKVEVSRKWYEPTIVEEVSANIPGKDPVGHFAKPNNLAKIKYPKVAPWMITAMNELGQMEIPGPNRANPRILEYHKSAHFSSTDDSGGENAWCAAFISWVMKQHGYALPQFAFRAMSWTTFGKATAKPTFGAIGIKGRRGGGHVAFVVGKSRDGKLLYMLGGNQNDEVSINYYKKEDWIKFVVPGDYNSRYDLLPNYSNNTGAAGRES
ncbi:MAG: TIGR02594 family protein, partial [Desulfatitalea sp.]